MLAICVPDISHIRDSVLHLFTENSGSAAFAAGFAGRLEDPGSVTAETYSSELCCGSIEDLVSMPIPFSIGVAVIIVVS